MARPQTLMQGNPDAIARTLSVEAKRLMEGMLQRVKRNPDIADFHVVFKRELETRTIRIEETQ